MSAAQHLLLVDDDKELCALLSKFLTRHGYRVSVVHNGHEMASILETSRINLVILDLMLPGDDGLALCRRIRASSTLPIIMLTAMADEVDRIIGLEMGADDYLAKVANPRELLARVRAVLRRAAPCCAVPARPKPARRQIKSASLNLPAGVSMSPTAS
jgi:two-component system OmpR family response regulator